jgi:hypothetical protein
VDWLNAIPEMFPQLYRARIPPSQTWSDLLANPDYMLAARFLLQNAALVGIAMLFGLGLIAVLTRKGHTLNTRLGMATLAFLGTGIGLGIMIAELFLLGLFYLLTPANVAIAFTLSGGMACAALIHHRDTMADLIERPLLSINSTITLAVFTLIAVIQFGSVSAPLASDATSYHMPYAAFMLKEHGLSVHEHLIYPYHSLNINLFYSLALMIQHELTFAQSVNALFASMTMMGMYLFGRSLGQRHGIAIALLILFVQIYCVRFNRFIANVDMGSMFFVFLCTFALYLWSQNKRATWLLIGSAIGLGIAMGSKYLMCIFALPAGLFIIATARKECARPLAIYIAWSACFGLWWYIRNWILIGNPVHPFAPGIFGYQLWDEADMIQQMYPILNTFLPRSLEGFLAMPKFAYESEVLFHHGPFIMISMLYGATALCWFAGRNSLIFLPFIWIYLVSWVFGSQDPRHFLPIAPLIYLYTGSAINGLISAMGVGTGKLLFLRNERAKQIIALSFSICLCVGALMFAAHDARNKSVSVFNSGIAPRPGVDPKRRRSYTLEIDIIERANDLFKPDEVIYEFTMRDARWFYNGTMVGAPFGPHGYWRIITAAGRQTPGGGIDPQKLEDILKSRYGAVGFVIPNAVDDPSMSLPYKNSEFEAQFDLLYRNEAGSIYRFKTPPAKALPTEN